MPVGAARAVTLPPSLARGAVTRETAAELMRAAMFASRRRRASARWRVPVTADAAVMPRHPRTAASKRPRKNQDFDSGRLPGIGKSALLIGRALSDWVPYRSTDVDSAKSEETWPVARRPGAGRRDNSRWLAPRAALLAAVQHGAWHPQGLHASFPRAGQATVGETRAVPDAKAPSQRLGIVRWAWVSSRPSRG